MPDTLDSVCLDTGLKQECRGAWKPGKRSHMEGRCHRLRACCSRSSGSQLKRREEEVGELEEGKAVRACVLAGQLGGQRGMLPARLFFSLSQSDLIWRMKLRGNA